MSYQAWLGLRKGKWVSEIDVRDFIMHNFSPYVGNENFLSEPTEATNELWEQVMDLTKQERDNGGVLDMDTEIVSTITSHGPGYLNKNKEKIVGFQTDRKSTRLNSSHVAISYAV